MMMGFEYYMSPQYQHDLRLEIERLNDEIMELENRTELTSEDKEELSKKKEELERKSKELANDIEKRGKKYI